mmetsp:Transcript_18713/g.41594  ORF Transcript_18713/g.41594 Transcript_18713/m.41594 type:complete len:139 (+) Transcript_18713:247-663(+)
MNWLSDMPPNRPIPHSAREWCAAACHCCTKQADEPRKERGVTWRERVPPAPAYLAYDADKIARAATPPWVSPRNFVANSLERRDPQYLFFMPRSSMLWIVRSWYDEERFRATYRDNEQRSRLIAENFAAANSRRQLLF